jgi:SAM-dependent methyltransferase
VICPVCEERGLVPFLEVEQLPVFCNVLWTSREEAVRAPRGDVRLGVCEGCGMVRNLAFDPELVAYSPAYENSLHFSPTFQAYAHSLADRLISRYDLYGKDVIDIGSGNGDFLSLLCEETGNRGVGFDPSYDGDELDESGRLELVRDYYSDADSERPADLISCRHVLEHVASPRELVTTVARARGTQGETTLYFEVPDGGYMLREAAVWDVIYEHPSYFTAPALRRLFEVSGLAVLDLGVAFGGQYLWIEAAHQGPGKPANGASPAPAELARHARAFGRAYSDKIERWTERLERLREEGRRVALWGAGSKGVTFLNLVAGAGGVETAVDLNVRKHGRYVPGTGHEVTSPEELRSSPPDVVLVMNGLYKDEIRARLDELGLRPEVLPV